MKILEIIEDRNLFLLYVENMLTQLSYGKVGLSKDTSIPKRFFANPGKSAENIFFLRKKKTLFFIFQKTQKISYGFAEPLRGRNRKSIF